MFSQMSTECLIKRFGLTLEEAKNRIFLMPLMATATIPLYSFLAGKFGKKLLILTVGYCLIIGSHLIMLLIPAVTSTGENQSTKTILYFCIFLLSQYRAITGSIVYSAVSLSSPSTATSLAFGITLCTHNLVGVVLPNILGAIIKDDTYTAFQNGLYFALLMASLGIMVSITLLFHDLRKGGLLWHPENGDKVKALKNLINKRAIDRQNEKYASKSKFFLVLAYGIEDITQTYASLGGKNRELGQREAN